MKASQLLVAVVSSFCLALVVPVARPTAAATPYGDRADATSTASVSGSWTLTTKLCTCGCTIRFDLLEQKSGHVPNPHDGAVYGPVADRVSDLTDTLGPGHTWECTATLNRSLTKRPRGSFTTISGTTTKTGSCKMTMAPKKKEKK